MGRVANTKTRGVRIDDELWTRAMERAKRRRESVADVVRRALLAYIEEDDADDVVRQDGIEPPTARV